jgi:transporter family-2 protein
MGCGSLKGVLVQLLLTVAAVAIGAAVTIQAGLNAQLARHVGGSLRAASISFVVATAAIAAVTAVATRGSPLRVGGPWWAWLGGLGGALFIGAGTALVPRLGAVNLFVAVVLGQIVCSAVLDRFGLLYRHQGLSPARLAGIGLVLAGVALVRIA